MAKLKCLACGQENKVGEESCTRCSSMLNLRLCSACEAINDHTAERCHGCGEEFTNDVSVSTPAEDRATFVEPEPARREATKVEATVEVAMIEGLAPRSLPTRRLIDLPPRRGTRIAHAAALWTGAIVVGLGAGYGYHRYQASGGPAVSASSAPEVPLAAKPPAASASAEPIPAAEPTVAPAPASPKTPKSSATQAKPRAEPKGRVATVTHTQAGSGPAEAPARPSAPAPHSRVTHTKAPVPGEAAAVAASAATQPPIEKPMNPNPSVCAPAVEALGLCTSK